MLLYHTATACESLSFLFYLLLFFSGERTHRGLLPQLPQTSAFAAAGFYGYGLCNRETPHLCWQKSKPMFDSGRPFLWPLNDDDLWRMPTYILKLSQRVSGSVDRKYPNHQLSQHRSLATWETPNEPHKKKKKQSIHFLWGSPAKKMRISIQSYYHQNNHKTTTTPLYSHPTTRSHSRFTRSSCEVFIQVNYLTRCSRICTKKGSRSCHMCCLQKAASYHPEKKQEKK